jgi:phosphoserine aminotransferase
MNFNAGPATLPLPALERAQKELVDWAGTGMSVMEHSHRGKAYEALHAETRELLRELLGLDDSWAILFLQGGATQEFATVPMNFLGAGAAADYVVNGTWGAKALAEAKSVATLLGGAARAAADTGMPAAGAGKPGATSYTRVPREDEIARDTKAAFLHFTSNETIDGLAFEAAAEPDGPRAAAPWPAAKGVPIVCDMSSDFLWRPMDLSAFSLVYAGAQKNVGPSGVTIVLVKKDFAAKGRTDIPKIFQYRTHVESDSLYNTPPTFGVYLARNVLAWIKESGGLARLEKDNREKARLLYAQIDAHPQVFAGPIEKASRSVMNIVFRLPTPALEDRFVKEAEARGMIGLRGHRSVGGIRASLYNAVPVAWAEALASFMAEFAKTAL